MAEAQLVIPMPPQPGRAPRRRRAITERTQSAVVFLRKHRVPTYRHTDAVFEMDGRHVDTDTLIRCATSMGWRWAKPAKN